MTIDKLLLLVGMNLRTSRKRMLLYWIMLAVTSMFLFAITICYEQIIISVDSNLNAATDMTSYRTFIFTGDAEQVQNYPEIESIQMIARETNEYKITVTDYQTVLKTVQKIEDQAIGTLTVNGDSLMEIELFLKIKRIIQICFILMFTGTIGTLYLLIQKRFQDRYYEISLYKAVGYDSMQILPLIWIELFVLLLTSSAAAFMAAYAVYSFFETRVKEILAQSLFAFEQQGNFDSKVGLVALIIIFLALASVWKIRNEIQKIDASALRTKL